MGIFNKIRKAFRKGEALPHEHGPAVMIANKKTGETVTIKIVPATTDDKPTTIPSEYAKAVVQKQKAASKTKPSKDAENKKAPVAAKKPVPKAAAKKEAIKKDLADTPVAKKPAPKKTSAKPAVKKSTPKKK
jgi:ribosomal protein L21E